MPAPAGALRSLAPTHSLLAARPLRRNRATRPRSSTHRAKNTPLREKPTLATARWRTSARSSCASTNSHTFAKGRIHTAFHDEHSGMRRRLAQLPISSRVDRSVLGSSHILHYKGAMKRRDFLARWELDFLKINLPFLEMEG